MAIETATLIMKVDTSGMDAAAKKAGELQNAGASLEQSLLRQMALHGKTGRAAQVRYDTERGAMAGLTSVHKQRLVNLATEMDRMESLTKQAKHLGIALGTIVAVGGGFLLKGFIDNTIEAENATAQLEARLKSTGGAAGMTLKSLEDLAGGLQEVTKYDDEAIEGSEALLLTFTRVGSDIFPRATRAILDTATALGTDLHGATLMVGKALNDPVKGMMALGRAGVQFTKDQKQLVKNLVESGDAAAAQKIILKELETQMGGAAVAARNTLGGALAHLKNTFGELLEGDTGSEGVVGTKEAIEALADTMKGQDVKDGFQAMIQGAARVTAAVAKMVAQTVGGIKVLSENMAAAMHGAAIGDAVRLDDQLGKLQRDRDALIGKGGKLKGAIHLLFGGESGEVGYTGSAESQLKNLDNKIADTKHKIEITDQMAQDAIALQRQAAGKSTANADTGEDPEDPGSAKDDKRAADKARKAAEERAEELQNLKDSLRTEEESINDSYNARQAIIDSHTELGADARKELTSRNKEQLDQEMADLSESKGKELESLRQSLRTEEETINESYQARLAILIANTAEGSKVREELQARLQTEYADDIQAYKDAQRQKLEAVYDGFLTEQEERQKYYDEERDLILRATEDNEMARQDLLRRLQEKFNQEQIQREREKNEAITHTAGDMFGAIADLASTYAKGHSKEAKKAFEIQKAASIAQTIIKTYESATGAYASLSSIPYVGPALGAAAAAAAVIAGIANVRQIQSQTFTEHDQGGRIPAGKIGIVGEYGPEFVRGPAAITARQLTQQTLNSGGGGRPISFESSFHFYGDAANQSSSTNAGREDQAREFKALVDARFRDLVNQEQRAGGSLWRMQHG